MGMFDGLNDPSIPVGGQRLYFKAGNYRVKINMLKSITPADAFDGVGSFIVESIVVKSSVRQLKSGAVVGWVIKLKKKFIASCFRDIKGFFAAVFDKQGSDLDDFVFNELGYKAKNPDTGKRDLPDYAALVAEMSSEANPLESVELDLVCTEKDNKEGTGVYTVHRWHPAGYLDDEAFE